MQMERPVDRPVEGRQKQVEVVRTVLVELPDPREIDKMLSVTLRAAQRAVNVRDSSAGYGMDYCPPTPPAETSDLEEHSSQATTIPPNWSWPPKAKEQSDGSSKENEFDERSESKYDRAGP
jgi:hypothetical protein